MERLALPQENLYTLADVLAWDEQERVELIDGVPVMMAPPSSAHQEISVEIVRQLANFLAGKTCKVYHAPFGVRLFERAGDTPQNVDTIVEPDISVVCDRNKIDKRGCRGAPDFIIEILSPSTRRLDRITKFNLYQQAGVREYWIVDPEDKSVQAFVLEDGRYTAKAFDAAEEKMAVSVLEGCSIDLTELFGE